MVHINLYCTTRVLEKLNQRFTLNFNKINKDITLRISANH